MVSPQERESYVSFHLANTDGLVRGSGEEAQQTTRVKIPGCWVLGNAWHRCGVRQGGELRQRVLSTQRWRKPPADTGPLREQQPWKEQTVGRGKSG